MESVFLSINFKTIDPLIRENLFFFHRKITCCVLWFAVCFFLLSNQNPRLDGGTR